MRGLAGFLIVAAIIYILFPGFFLFALVGGFFHLLIMLVLAWVIIKVLLALFSVVAAVILFPLFLVVGLLLFPILIPFAVIYLICLGLGALSGHKKIRTS